MSFNNSEVPTFIQYLPEFNVLQFGNISRNTSGKSYQFKISVKELNSDQVMTNYHAAVHVNGDVVPPAPEVPEVANVTETNATANSTVDSNTTTNESSSTNQTQNETRIVNETTNETIVFRNQTKPQRENLARGMSIKFNNYFEYAVGSTNHS